MKKIKIAAFMIYILQWFLYLTCRKKYLGKDMIDEPCVVLFWHQKLTMMPFTYKKLYKNRGIKKTPYVMISMHKDGELISSNISFFGIKSIRGSTYEGSVKVLKEAFKTLDDKNDIFITPDGPRGPLKSISFGSYAIARKKEVKTIIFDYKLSSFWTLNSWDKLMIPKPFSKIYYMVGEPFLIKEKDDTLAQKQVQDEFLKVEQKLEEIA